MRIRRITNIKNATLLFIYCLFVAEFAIYKAPNAVALPQYSENAVVRFQKFRVNGRDTVFTNFGTGFMMQDTASGINMIVTNRHILDGRAEIAVVFNETDKNSVRRIAHLLESDGSTRWIGNPDPAIDLAVLPVPPLNGGRAISTARLKLSGKMRLGDEVVVIGFGLSEIAGTSHNYPMVRGGVVSYIAENDILDPVDSQKTLLKSRTFLIDTRIQPGNSGSPVFSTAGDGTRKASLIGIVKGHFYDIKTKENMDLGIVISADFIRETLDLFLRK